MCYWYVRNENKESNNEWQKKNEEIFFQENTLQRLNEREREKERNIYIKLNYNNNNNPLP